MKPQFKIFCGLFGILNSPQSCKNVPPLEPPYVESGKIKDSIVLCVIFLSSFFCSFNSVANDSLIVNSLIVNDSVYTELIEYYERKTVVEIQEYTVKNKFKWLNFLPSFGYDFISNRPLLGWNSRQLFNALNSKRNKKALILQIIKTNQMKCASDYRRLERLVFRLSRMKLVYSNLLIRKDLERGILEIKEQQFKKHKITNEEYFRANISFNEVELRVSNLELQILELYNTIQEVSHSKENVNLFNSFDYVTTD